MAKFVNARFARFTNSNPKLRRCLSLDWDFLISLRSIKKSPIPSQFFVTPVKIRYFA